MKLPSIFKNKETRQEVLQWPSSNHPKTQSFRAEEDIFKTVNSIYSDPLCLDSANGTFQLESWFTNSSAEIASFSGTESSEELDESVEMIIRGVRSDRLFFEPEDTSSILEVQEEEDDDENDDVFEENVVLAMESQDPYVDFKKSMEEMVEMHGMKDWESLEEMLEWYLKMNGKMNHGFIVGAFLDLLIEINFCDHGSFDHDDSSFMSASSSFSSHPSPPSPFSQINKTG